jgi:uncharacterized protein (DUF362 family)
MGTERSKVAVLKTAPGTVLDDIGRLMRLADYRRHIPTDTEIALKINISWAKFYPACSTTPWQLDGVIRTLLEDGYDRDAIYGCHNRTVVVSARRGEVLNRHRPVLVERHGLRNVHLYEGEEWVRYRPKGEMLVLDRVFKDGIHIPRRLIGDAVIHLPTMKTHVFTTITGAMKNAFGGLLHEKRHWTHSVIHETLVDLLTIQKEIHSGIFAVMDATFAGDGPGPRAMTWHETDRLLAGADPVAVDAIAAKMMGFDPLSIPFIRIAHERGLGCGDPREIEVVGEEIGDVNFHFRGNRDTLASRGQKLIYHGALKPLESFLLRSAITPWSYLASWLYHDVYWYPLIGRRRVARALKTKWGKLFLSY